MLSKEEIKRKLLIGETLDDLFEWMEDSECVFFKGPWNPGKPEEVIYVPDIDLNELVTDRPLTPEEVSDALRHMYTTQDFMDICDEDVPFIGKLCYWWCNWQHPATAYHENGPFFYIDEETFVEQTGVTFAQYTKRRNHV